MKRTVIVALGAALLLPACGGKQSKVKSQEERLSDQLFLADEQVAKQEESKSKFEAAESDSEKAEKFDVDHAKHELKRASLNAVDCPNTFEKSQLVGYKPGTAELQVTFANDGSVSKLVLGPPYEGTPVGDCVERAIESVRVKLYQGELVTVNWKVELKEAKPQETKPAPKK